METITWQDFSKVELRVGKIISVDDFPEARNPAYKVSVDFGEAIGTKKSSAQITHHYQKEELVGRLVVCVINFPKKQIGSMMSECLITGFHDDNNQVRLCMPEGQVPLGAKLC